LTIYGSICKYSNLLDKYKNVYVYGTFEDPVTVYNEVDIIINPVRFGAGIKIKNIEALGSGIPLITLQHGAIGLEDIVNKGLLIAKDENDFTEKLNLLIEDYNLRKTIAGLACNYVSRFFSSQYCYEPLLQCILRD
jgi:glycosyltransferase involved in cell wall biosynthesis